jgi:hypothetical protein
VWKLSPPSSFKVRFEGRSLSCWALQPTACDSAPMGTSLPALLVWAPTPHQPSHPPTDVRETRHPDSHPDMRCAVSGMQRTRGECRESSISFHFVSLLSLRKTY